jgi:hypothetical protein
MVEGRASRSDKICRSNLKFKSLKLKKTMIETKSHDRNETKAMIETKSHDRNESPKRMAFETKNRTESHIYRVVKKDLFIGLDFSRNSQRVVQ